MGASDDKSQYTVDVMIEKVRKNINRSAEMAMDGRLDMSCTGALITIAQGLNILARQIERAWEEKNITNKNGGKDNGHGMQTVNQHSKRHGGRDPGGRAGDTDH